MGDFFIIKPRTRNDTPEAVSRLLDQSEFTTLHFVCSALTTSFSLFGVFANSLTIHIFLHLGLRDSVTVSFLGLSLSDLMVSFFRTIWGTSIILFAFELRHGAVFLVDPFVVKVLSGRTSQMFYSVTVLNSLFIAVARCVCVLKPLQFKPLFTTTRTGMSILFFNVFILLFTIPKFMSMNVVNEFIPTLNRSRYMFRGDRSTATIRRYQDFFLHTLVPLTTQVVMFVCVLGMTWALKKSAKFRQRNTGTEKNAQQSESTKTAAKSGAVETSDKLSTKEQQAIRQVLVICIVYMVCNLPKIIDHFADPLVPEYGPNPREYRFARLHASSLQIRYVFEALNSSMNIVIYLTYNHKFFN